MRYVFWLGGKGAFARALPDYTFWCNGDKLEGCKVALKVGCVIPQSAYLWADLKVSQGRMSNMRGQMFGWNATALVPLEV